MAAKSIWRESFKNLIKKKVLEQRFSTVIRRATFLTFGCGLGTDGRSRGGTHYTGLKLDPVSPGIGVNYSQVVLRYTGLITRD